MRFKGNVLHQIYVINQLDQINDYRFSQIKINSSLSPRLFQFRPPKGVDIVDQ